MDCEVVIALQRQDVPHQYSHRRKIGKTLAMRINLPSGTPAEIDTTVASPTMGLVIAPDIFSLRPLFAEMVTRLAQE